MCVFKYHAFIYFLRPPPWYGTFIIYGLYFFQLTSICVFIEKCASPQPVKYWANQCCGSRPFWYGCRSCWSLRSGSGFSIWYGSGYDCLIRIRLFNLDPDPYCFKEKMYLHNKAYFVKFSLPINFAVLIRVAYGSGSQNTLIRILENDTDHYESGSAILEQTQVRRHIHSRF